MHIDRINNSTTYMEHIGRRSMAGGDANGTYGRKPNEGFVHPFECSKVEENRLKNELNPPKVDRESKSINDHDLSAKHSQNGDIKHADLPTDLSNKRSDPKTVDKPDDSVDMNRSLIGSPVESHMNGKRSQKVATDYTNNSPDRSYLARGEMKNFVCFQCGLTFTNQNEYELHVSSHFLISTTEYICTFGCNKHFPNSENMLKHLLETHAQNVWKCSICYELFETKAAIQIHFAVAHSNKEDTFRCSACMEAFETENEFKNHVRTQHSLMFSTNLQCSSCRAVCSSELEMHFHMATHSRQYRCTLCSEAFPVEFLLERHMQTHHSHHSPVEKDSLSAYKIDNLNNNLFDYNYAAAKKMYPFGSASTKLFDTLHIQTSNSASPLKLPPPLYELYDNIGKSFAQQSLSKHFSNISKTFSEQLDHTQTFAKHFSEHSTDIPQFISLYKSDYAAKAFGRSNPLLFLPPPPTSESHSSSIDQQYGEKKKSSDQSQYVCNICERSDFQTELEMLTHQKIAHNIKTGVSLMCAYCNDNFRSRYLFFLHLNIFTLA